MSLINGFVTESIPTKRFAAGSLAKGIYTRGTPSSITIDAAVMPLNGRDKLLLPEGERTKATIKIYSVDPFLTADALNFKDADVITWKGVEYEIIHTENWHNNNFFNLSHYKSFAAKLEVDSDKRARQ